MTNPKYIAGNHVSLAAHSFPGGPFKVLQGIRSDRGEAFYRVRPDRESVKRVVAERQILSSTSVARSVADAVFGEAR